MRSTAPTILAVALPFGLCLLFAIALLLGLFLLQRRQRQKYHKEIENAREDLSKLEKRLKSYPKGFSDNDFECGYSGDEVKTSFIRLNIAVSKFISTWIPYHIPSSQINDSLSRIEGVLFTEPEAKHSLNINKDIRIFRNPHNYTSAEIMMYLEQDDTRQKISEYLIMSIILPNLTLDGDPFKTLLPFSPSTVCALDRLFNAIRHVDLFDVLPIHIAKFGFYYSNKPTGRHYTTDMYFRLFETIFAPYYTSQPESNKPNPPGRLQDFNKVVEEAVRHGMVVLGYPYSTIEYRWDDRPKEDITRYPAVYSLNLTGKRLQSAPNKLLINTSYKEDNPNNEGGRIVPPNLREYLLDET